MGRTISHKNSKIYQVDRQIYPDTRFSTCTMLESGPIRLVGPLALVITYF
jgi:hypothetical protein